MQRATNMAMAFINAAVKADKNQHWVARCVQDRVDHTSVGVVKEPDVFVHVRNKTRIDIALNQRVIV